VDPSFYRMNFDEYFDLPLFSYCQFLRDYVYTEVGSTNLVNEEQFERLSQQTLL
jgi:hypothetical protein